MPMHRHKKGTQKWIGPTWRPLCANHVDHHGAGSPLHLYSLTSYVISCDQYAVFCINVACSDLECDSTSSIQSTVPRRLDVSVKNRADLSLHCIGNQLVLR